MLKNIDTSNDVDQGCKQQYRNWRIKWAIVLMLSLCYLGYLVWIFVDRTGSSDKYSILRVMYDVGGFSLFVLFVLTIWFPLMFIVYIIFAFPFHRAYLTYSGDEVYIWRWRNSIAVTKVDIASHKYAPMSNTDNVIIAHHEIKLLDGKVIKTVWANQKRRDELKRFYNPYWPVKQKRQWFFKSKKNKPPKPTPSGRKIK